MTDKTWIAFEGFATRLTEASAPKVRTLVEKVVGETRNLQDVLLKLEQLFTKLKNDITLRANLEKVPQLQIRPEPSHVDQFFVEFEEMSEQGKLLF